MVWQTFAMTSIAAILWRREPDFSPCTEEAAILWRREPDFSPWEEAVMVAGCFSQAEAYVRIRSRPLTTAIGMMH